MLKPLVGLMVVGTLLLQSCKSKNNGKDDISENKGLFQKNALWDKSQAYICFADDASGSAQLRSYIKAVINKEINERTVFRFKGFQLCSSSTQGQIEVRILAKGRANAGSIGGSQDNFYLMLSHFVPSYQLRAPMQLFLSWEDGVNVSDIEMHNIIVHEFGHALGLHHEQNRSDNANGAKCNVQVETQPVESQAVGSFDVNSIMNYCNPNYFAKYITLSAGDIATIKKAYGALAAGESRGELLRCDKNGLMNCIENKGGSGCAVKYCVGGTYLCESRSLLEKCLKSDGGLSCLAKSGCAGT